MSKPDSLECTLHRAPSRGETWVCVTGADQGQQRVVADIYYSTKPKGVLGTEETPGYHASVAFRVGTGTGTSLIFRCLGPEFFLNWKRVGSIDDVVI
jgi:hypothetical protein